MQFLTVKSLYPQSFEQHVENICIGLGDRFHPLFLLKYWLRYQVRTVVGGEKFYC